MHYLIRDPHKRRIVSLLDMVGRFFFTRRDRSLPEAVSSILLIRLDHLGDVILTTPAIRYLKKRYPHARLTMVVKEKSVEAIKNNPHLDNIVALKVSFTGLKRGYETFRWVTELCRVVRKLRKERFDIAIDFKGDIRSILLAYLSGASRRISYAIRGGGFLLSDIVPYEANIHEIDKNMKLLTPLGIASYGSTMELRFTDEDLATVERILLRQKVDLSRWTVAIHYGGASHFKRWDTERFVSLAETITVGNATNVLVFGGYHDGKDSSFEAKPEKGIYVMPDMTICQMAAAFKRCNLLVCNDSGPMHVGLAVGTPTVAIFGPTFPNLFGPRDSGKNRVVRSQSPCSPCWHPDKPIGCKERTCLKAIRVDEVAEVIRELRRNGVRSKGGSTGIGLL
jgi:heptosyltransferase-1